MFFFAPLDIKMTSEYRAPSQIPRNGTYVVTADCSGAVFSVNETTKVATALTGTTASVPRSGDVGAILYDMGKTVRATLSGGSTTYVLRKVQRARAGGTTTADDNFYISIGSLSSNATTDAVAASPVARL